MSKKSVSITVYGKVQRVGFRYFVKENAKSLGLNGFVKNLTDGSVYVEATGEENDLDTLIDYCKKGPDWARVEKVIITKTPIVEFDNFEIKY
ncbi:MAG: acylphosphatase [Bacteroidetes bacterium]|nr:acylphosphatase [Bacteroidota bacterium]